MLPGRRPQAPVDRAAERPFGATRELPPGQFGDNFPGDNHDVAAWLPEMCWPLWGAALATATYAYWLRRRPTAQ